MRNGFAVGGALIVAAGIAILALDADVETPPLPDAPVRESREEERVAPLLAGAARPAGPRGWPTSPGWIAGFVRDEHGHPVAGVRVALQRDDEADAGEEHLFAADPARWTRDPERVFDHEWWRRTSASAEAPEGSTVTTDADGAFRASVEEGTWHVAAMPEPPRCGEAKAVEVIAGLERGGIFLTVSTCAGDQGKVLDDAGRPLAGVWIHARGPSVVAPVRSAEDGTFPTTGLRAGEWNFEVVDAPGRAHVIPVSWPKRELVLRVPASVARVRGTVTNRSERPVADARLMLVVGATDGAETVLLATTDASGRYRTALSPPGPVRSVRVATPGRSFLDERVPLARWSGARVGPDDAIVDVTLATTATLAGRVLESGTGRALPGSRVAAYPADLSRGGRGTTTDANGQYRFDGLAHGRWVVLAHGDAHFMDRLSRCGRVRRSPTDAADTLHAVSVVVGAQGGLVEHDVVLERGLEVAGVVLGTDGAPVAGARVEASELWQSRVVTRNGSYGNHASPLATTDAAGRFAARRLPACDGLSFFASTSGGRVSDLSAPIALVAGEPAPFVTLRLREGASVSGRVVDEDGRGVAGALVRSNGNDERLRTHTETDGAFRVDGLPMGRAYLSATDRAGARVGGAPAEDLRPGEHRAGVEIHLSPRVHAVSGRALYEDGSPATAHTLVLVRGQGFDHATTGADGSFRFEYQHPGHVAIHQGGAQGPVLVPSVEVPAHGLRVVLPRAERTVVEGRVLDPAGEPVPFFLVTAVPKDLRGNAAHQASATHEGFEGNARFLVEGSPPIRLHIHDARDGAGRPLPVRAHEHIVDATSVTGWEVRLTPATAFEGRVVDQKGQGIPALRVSVPGSWAETDEEGHFTVMGEGPGPAAVTVEAHSRWVTPVTVEIAAGSPTDVPLRPSGRIAGIILDEDGTPAATAGVHASWKDGSGEGRSPSIQVRHARFVIDGIPPGVRVRLTVRDATRSRAPVVIEDVAPDTTNLVVRFTQGSVVRGRVVDAQGRPHGGGRIVLDNAIAAPVKADGTFAIRGLEAREYDLRHEGTAATLVLSPRVLRAPADDVTVVVADAQTIRGTVRGVRGPTFRVRAREEGGSGLQTQVFREQGPDFFVGRSPDPRAPRDVRFMVWPVGGLRTWSVMASDGEGWGVAEGVKPGRADLVIELRPGLSIAGTVTKDGLPVAARVQVSDERWEMQGASRPDGTFHFGGLPPGPFVVRAFAHDGAFTDERTVEAGTTDLRLDLR